MTAVPGIASFHLSREHHAATAMARLALDRRRLARVDGLRFWRLLGTGSGSSTGPGADLHRTAMFAVWDGDAALDNHLASTAARRETAAEEWHVRLRGAGGHGTWRGVDVLGEIDTAPKGTGVDAPVAVLTRANVRVGAWRRFRAAGRPVDAELAATEGLLALVGVGEAPIGRLATFSLWRDADSMRRFADGGPNHREVVRRTRTEQWYGEELFARFRPYRSSGSWDGRDPLADSGINIP
jgi:hypothetical protein